MTCTKELSITVSPPATCQSSLATAFGGPYSYMASTSSGVSGTPFDVTYVATTPPLANCFARLMLHFDLQYNTPSAGTLEMTLTKNGSTVANQVWPAGASPVHYDIWFANIEYVVPNSYHYVLIYFASNAIVSGTAELYFP